MSESTLEKSLRRWCQKRRYLYLKLALINQLGWPDRCIIKPGGVVCFVELKRPDGGGKLSKRQIYWINTLKAFDVRVGVASSVEEFERIVEG